VIRRAAHAALGRVLPWLFLAWLSLSGCSLLGASQPRVERFNCQVRALKPLVGDVLDTEQLVKDLYAGKASLNAVLANIDVTAAELMKLQADLQACEPPMPVPQRDPS
jgi:hypothetical protein